MTNGHAALPRSRRADESPDPKLGPSLRYPESCVRASCPAGSSLTGGGGVDSSSTGYLLVSVPTSDSRSWLVAIGITEFSGDGTGDSAAYAMCWGPNGKPVGTAKEGHQAERRGPGDATRGAGRALIQRH